MELENAEKLAKELMLKHGLKRWTFKWAKTRSRFGACHWNKQTIELSSLFVAINEPSRVLETILHEIAHALAGSKHGHDKHWKAIAKQLGCKSLSRYYKPDDTIIPYRYRTVCSVHGKVGFAIRRGECSCAKCNPDAYDSRFPLTYEPYEQDDTGDNDAIKSLVSLHGQSCLLEC